MTQNNRTKAKILLPARIPARAGAARPPEEANPQGLPRDHLVDHSRGFYK